MLQPEELRATFQENMRIRRLELGLTQVQLAERITGHQAYIAALELGKKAPTLDTVAAIAIALQTTPAALLSPGIFSKPALTATI